jgi:hypothetical protein
LIKVEVAPSTSIVVFAPSRRSEASEADATPQSQPRWGTHRQSACLPASRPATPAGLREQQHRGATPARMADAEAAEAREGRAERLAASPEQPPAPDDRGADAATTSDEAAEADAGEPKPAAEPEQLPTLEDDLLSQALAMGSEHFPVPSLCLAARTARSPRGFALKEAGKRFAALGWQPEQLPSGLGGLGPLARLSAACVLEGLTVSVPKRGEARAEARLCRLLRAFGAAVVRDVAAGAEFTVFPLGCSPAATATAQHDATPVIPAVALEAFIFSPFVSSSRRFENGKELSEDQIAEVLAGYEGYACVLRTKHVAT